MFEVYAFKLLSQLPFVLLLIGSIPRLRANRHWANWLQFIGPCIVIIFLVQDWVLYDPFFGILRHTIETMNAEEAAAYDPPPYWYFFLLMPAVGFLLFSVGYLYRDKATEAGSFESTDTSTTPGPSGAGRR